MPRILKNIRIDEVSAVTKGAGEGTRIVIMKRHDDSSVYDEPWYREQAAIAERQNEAHLREHDEPEKSPFWKYFHRKSFAALAAGDEATRHDEETTVDELVDGDGDAGGADHHASKVADLLVESGTHTDRSQALAWLLHHRDGNALLRRLKKQHEEPSMTKEQLEAERLAKLRALNPVEIAKVLVHDQDARQISEAEFVDMISRHNPQPGETPAQTFSRHYEANTPDGALLRAGMQVTKAAEAARYFDLQPQFVGGAAALNVDDPSEAIAQLTRIGRQKWPTASEAEAFERAFTDPANAELAKKAYRRPSATSVYPMPR